jgi:hypothetical protein
MLRGAGNVPGEYLGGKWGKLDRISGDRRGSGR